MLKWNRYVFLYLIVIPVSLVAQVNMESYRESMSNANGAFHSLESDFQYASGNSNYRTFRFQWRTDYVSDWGRSFVLGNMKLGRNSGNSFIDQHFLHIRLIKPVDLVKLEFFLQQESNQLLYVSKRQLIGSGIRLPLHNQYRLYSKFKTFLGLGVMLEYEQEKGVSSIGRTLKSTNYLSYVWDYSPQINLSATLYYQFALEDQQDYRLLLDQELSCNLTDLISMTFGFHYRYEERPFTGLKKRDLELTNGIRMTF